MRIDGVWDIECANWDQFVVGMATSITSPKTDFVAWDSDEVADYMLSRKGIWYAHNGGAYDMLWLAEQAYRRGIKCVMRTRGASIIAMTVGKGLEFRDSFALVPMSLADGSLLGNVQKSKFSLPCECKKVDCGGFCVLARIKKQGPTAYERRQIESYLETDCRALESMLDAVSTRAAEMDLTLGRTIGATAWKTAKAWLSLPDCEHNLGTYELYRETYYGGRTEDFISRTPHGHRYDIHSSYPAALTRVALPVGPSRRVRLSEASAAFASGKPGMYWADVVVPECHIPPLPYRAGDRLLYPWGPIEGAWTQVELAHAQECGVTIDRITMAQIYDESSAFLAPYAQRVWEYRERETRTGTAQGKQWGKWLKLLANSLTGKCASKPIHSTLTFRPYPEVGEGKPIPVQTGSFWPVERVSVDPCAHVEWAAYLTSEARVELHKQLLHAGDGAIYCDTDSVYSVSELTRRLGDDLGEWGYEGELRDWKCLAPKIYQYRDSDDEVRVKGKGMSGLDEDGFDMLSRGGDWLSERGVQSLKMRLSRVSARVQAVKDGGLFKRKTLTRSLSPVKGWMGGRALEKSGRTRAVTIAQYLDAEAVRRETRSDATKRRKARKAA